MYVDVKEKMKHEENGEDMYVFGDSNRHLLI